MSPPFRIKICGVTSAEDAHLAAEAGADAVGLNFFAGSSRYVPPLRAAALRREGPDRLCWVGVFVNARVSEVAAIAEQAHLDALQFHGDEPPTYLAEVRAAGGPLADIPVVRAFRCRENAYWQIQAYLERAASLEATPDAALIDAFVEGQYGGAGISLDWRAFREARPIFSDLPLILAGGLNAENVAAAIEAARPDGVDVASGVEAEPGKKDPEAVRRFVESARRAMATHGLV